MESIAAKDIARKGFDIDLQDGLLREEAFGNVLRNAKVEIKSDEQASKTGNLFIEYLDHGQPSGILTTEADYWAFEIYPDHWLIVPIQRLKVLCSRAQIELKIVKGGDYNQYNGYLVPVDWCLKHNRQEDIQNEIQGHQDRMEL